MAVRASGCTSLVPSDIPEATGFWVGDHDLVLQVGCLQGLLVTPSPGVAHTMVLNPTARQQTSGLNH